MRNRSAGADVKSTNIIRLIHWRLFD